MSINSRLKTTDDVLAHIDATGQPLAYIEQQAWFYGRRFFVDENVLIPRPETEQIVDCLRDFKASTRLLDLGTGSGCIGITLQLEHPTWQVTLSDISQKALDIARQNWQNLSSNPQNTPVRFVKSDLFSHINGQFDVITANLPYVDKTWPWLDHRALAFEPSVALFAADHGLALIKKLLDEAAPYLSPKGRLAIELDPCQMANIKNRAKLRGYSVDGESPYTLLLKAE